MRAVVILCASLLVSGCASRVTRENIAEQDDATCQSYGAKPQTDAYVACRVKQQEIRAGLSAANTLANAQSTCVRSGSVTNCF